MTTQRLEALSDGVFAVAMTLLATDVHLPSLPADATEDTLVASVVSLGPKLVCYVMSFVLGGMFWIAHHRVFATIRRVDRFLLWINLLFLLWVCLLPFAASTFGSHILMRTGAVVYGANVIMIGLGLFAIWRYACTRSLLVAGTSPDFIRLTYQRSLIGTPIYALGIIVAFWTPKASVVIYLFALVFYLIPNPLDKHFRLKDEE